MTEVVIALGIAVVVGVVIATGLRNMLKSEAAARARTEAEREYTEVLNDLKRDLLYRDQSRALIVTPRSITIPIIDAGRPRSVSYATSCQRPPAAVRGADFTAVGAALAGCACPGMQRPILTVDRTGVTGGVRIVYPHYQGPSNGSAENNVVALAGCFQQQTSLGASFIELRADVGILGDTGKVVVQGRSALVPAGSPSGLQIQK